MPDLSQPDMVNRLHDFGVRVIQTEQKHSRQEWSKNIAQQLNGRVTALQAEQVLILGEALGRINADQLSRIVTLLKAYNQTSGPI